MSFSFTIAYRRRYFKILFARHILLVYCMGRWLSTNDRENRCLCGHIRTVRISIRTSHTKYSVLFLCVLFHPITTLCLSLSRQRSNTNDLSKHAHINHSHDCRHETEWLWVSYLSSAVACAPSGFLLVLFRKFNSCLDTASQKDSPSLSSAPLSIGLQLTQFSLNFQFMRISQFKLNFHWSREYMHELHWRAFQTH